MKDLSHSTPDVCPETTANGEIVSIFVDYDHPLLQLWQILPWAQITELLIQEWRLSGKNVDGGPGRPLDVSLYVPLVVLMMVQGFNSRQMEAYVSENVVARVFISRQDQVTAAIRDHANIARVYAALSQEGLEALNTLVVHEAKRHGFADASILSSDTTMQELPIGYPNEPGYYGVSPSAVCVRWRSWASKGLRVSKARWRRPTMSCAQSRSTICLPKAKKPSSRCWSESCWKPRPF